MAQFARGRAKQKIPQLVITLEGHRMSDHHRSLIRFSLDHLVFLEEQIRSIDAAVLQKISLSGYQQPFELLQTIPGIQEDSAASILAETGADMSVFPSAGHLSSWAGVCPGNRRSAGKDQGGRTTRGNRWLNGMLTQCAWAGKRCPSSGRTPTSEAHSSPHTLSPSAWRFGRIQCAALADATNYFRSSRLQ